MDGYAESWTAVVQQQCTAEQQGTVPTSIAAMRMACLQRRLHDLDALAGGVLEAEMVTSGQALSAANRLPSSERCATDEALAEVAGLEDPGLPADAVADIGPTLARARTQLALGQLDEAYASAKEASALAKTTGHPGVMAEAFYELAEVQRVRGDVDAAEATLASAAQNGIAARHHRVALRALMRRAYILGHEKRELARAEDLVTLAQAELEALGEYPEGVAELASTRAALQVARGDLEGARNLYAEVIRVRANEKDPDRSKLAQTYVNLGGLQLEAGLVDEAEANLRKAEEWLLELFPPGHETVVAVRSNLLMVDLLRGVSDETVRRAEQAIEDAVALLGDAHVDVGRLFAIQSKVLRVRGDLEHSLESAERAVQILMAALGEEDPEVLDQRGFFGELLRLSGQADRARDQLDGAIAAYDASGSVRPSYVELLQMRAFVHKDLGNANAAVADLRRAYASAAELPDAAWLLPAMVRFDLGCTLVEAGHPDEGLTHALAAIASLRAAADAGALDGVRVGLGIAEVGAALAQHRPNDPALPELVGAAREYLRNAPPERLAGNEFADWLAQQP